MSARNSNSPTAGNLEEQINALLPQTQCEKCGHPGCRPYARAIAAGEAINRCPPGGPAVISELAKLLKTPVLPLDTSRGEFLPRLRAYIREAECIGCTKCIQVCPTDAIMGGAKLMHTVIESECTGCDLCVAPCPVDCIDMLPARNFADNTDQQSRYWQQRFEFRQIRLLREKEGRSAQKAARLKAKEFGADIIADSALPSARKSAAQLKQEIQEAVARSHARKAGL